MNAVVRNVDALYEETPANDQDSPVKPDKPQDTPEQRSARVKSTWADLTREQRLARTAAAHKASRAYNKGATK